MTDFSNKVNGESPENSGKSSAERRGYARTRQRVKADGKFCNALFANVLRIIEPTLKDAGIFRRGGQLVRVRTTQTDSDRMKGLTIEGPTIDSYKADSLKTDITKVVSFYKTTPATATKPASDYDVGPDSDVIKAVLTLPDWPTTPILAGITSGPFIRPSGTICDAPGYDAETGWYLDYAGSPLKVPDNPTREDVKKSFDGLMELVSQFEWAVPDGFGGGVLPSKAGFLGYILTMAARPAISGPVPAFVFNSTSKGSGKTTLAAVANIIAYGYPPSVTQAASGDNAEEEMRKTLFSFARTGAQSILIDNWKTNGAVGGETLDYYATATSVTNRILKASTNEIAPWRAVISIGGNALSVTSDFGDRCVWMMLEPTVSDARERVPDGGFKFHPIGQHVEDNRETYLKYALTILRDHMVRQSPAAPGAANWGTFTAWSSIVRDCVMNLTGVDLKRSLAAADVEDENDSELTQLIDGLRDFQYHYGEGRRWQIGELYRHVNATASQDESAFRILRDVMDFEVKAKSFSKACIVRKHAKKTWDGYAISRKKVIGKKGEFSYLLEQVKKGRNG